MTFGESCLPPPKKERKSHSLLSSKAHTLECQDHGLSHQKGDLRCTRLPWMKGYNTWMCTGHVHEKCMGYAHRHQHVEKDSNISRHVLHRMDCDLRTSKSQD